MNTASLELCRHVHALLGWKDTAHQWTYYTDPSAPEVQDNGAIDYEIGEGSGLLFAHMICPAYDLGYLIRMLPIRNDGTPCPVIVKVKEDHWECGYDLNTIAVGDTPENAACKMIIQLVEQGILVKQ